MCQVRTEAGGERCSDTTFNDDGFRIYAHGTEVTFQHHGEQLFTLQVPAGMEIDNNDVHAACMQECPGNMPHGTGGTSQYVSFYGACSMNAEPTRVSGPEVPSLYMDELGCPFLATSGWSSVLPQDIMDNFATDCTNIHMECQPYACDGNNANCGDTAFNSAGYRIYAREDNDEGFVFQHHGYELYRYTQARERYDINQVIEECSRACPGNGARGTGENEHAFSGLCEYSGGGGSSHGGRSCRSIPRSTYNDLQMHGMDPVMCD
jgi:hypothetical protein